MSDRYHNLEAFRRTVEAMMADPEVTGHLLAAGIWLARASILREPPPGNWSFANIAADIFGGAAPHQMHSLKQVFKGDLPRYDYTYEEDWRRHQFTYRECAAPMIRRDGPCGQKTDRCHDLTDLETGRIYQVGACRRHKSWMDEQLLRNRDEVRALGEHLPKPPMNAGGALARHVPNIGWGKFWRNLDPSWEPPAEGTPTVKPKLRVLTFDPVDDPVEVAAGAPPVLRVVTGGWAPPPSR